MRKRSKYKPKGVLVDTMAWVKQGMQVVDQVPDAGLLLKIKNHEALASIVQGRGTRADVDVLISAVNVAEALAKFDIGADWFTEIKAGTSAIRDMARRALVREQPVRSTRR